MGQGKGALNRKKERRKREKRSRKEMNQTKFQRWAHDGVNSKSKRFSKRTTGRKGPRVRTPDQGNLGCLDSSQSLNMPALVRHKLLDLAGYDSQWSSRYGAQVSAYIRLHWHSLEAAWQAHGITPVRQDIPKSYNKKNWRRAA